MVKVRQSRRGQNLLLNRSPIQNSRASRYMLLMLLSFALSVSVTRLFLYLTGYPKLGSGSLHIAHVLWGGLLLFIACILPMVLVNNWAHTWSALLCGVGIGLFIDEVGKFITAITITSSPLQRPSLCLFPPLRPVVYSAQILAKIFSAGRNVHRPE